MISSESSAQQAASRSSGTETGTKRIVTSHGSRFPLRSAKMLAGSGVPPPEENPTERKYNFLLQAAFAWLRLLAAYLRLRTHYERAPCLRRQSAWAAHACGGFAPTPPGFSALVPLPIGSFTGQIAEGRRSSIPLYRSRPLSRRSGCFPVWGHRIDGQNAEGTEGDNEALGSAAVGRVCSGALFEPVFPVWPRIA
jgi:hypothetical protein